VLKVTQWSLRLVIAALSPGGADTAGLELVPARGPLLVCSNHLSNLDPLVFGAVFPRVMHAMAKAEMFANPLMRWYLEHCNCFPVWRGRPDRRALRSAAAVLESGGALVVFPEGHRSHGAGMLPFEPGIGFLALKTGATIVPCAIWGTEDSLPRGRLLPRRAQIHFRVGVPYRPQGGKPDDVAQEIQRRVSELLPTRYRVVS
jgi:1-acyl-sn-glycerol-3-phosphate acyltransferase